MRTLNLSDFGLETIAEMCARKGWGVPAAQKWAQGGLLPVVAVGTGRSAKYLVPITAADAFTPRGRGRPKTKAPEEPKPKKTASKAPAKPRKAKSA